MARKRARAGGRLAPGAGLAGLLLSALGLALAAAGRDWAWSQLGAVRPLAVAADARDGGGRGRRQATTMAATATNANARAAPKVKKVRSRTFIPTEEAPFLTAADQPLLLSPDGVRTARFELGDKGMQLRVEAAPAFGPEGSATAVATARDVIERVAIIPREKLGIMGVRDLFWLDDRCFLITGYDGPAGRFYGWIADLRLDRAILVAMPSRESSIFVPTGIDGLPLVRRDEHGAPELLLGFTTEGPDGSPLRSWSWYSVSSSDLVDAAVDEELPTRLWREAVLSRFGEIEALLLVNGSVHRRTPEGWRNIGTVMLAAAEGDAALAGLQTLLPREYLISAGPDYSVFAIDVLSPSSALPQVTPPMEDLVLAAGAGVEPRGIRPGGDVADVAAWVLGQCCERQTAALVHMTAEEGASPLPLFAHPFADVSPVGIWVDPETECPEAVMVEDLRPRAYALRHPTAKLLAALRQGLPAKVRLGDVAVPVEEMEPQVVYRHGDRWLVAYWHPALAKPLVLPALVQGGRVKWVGDRALPARGGALNAAAVPLRPRVEGHRLCVGAHDIPVYLVLPAEGDPVALIVRIHEGPQQRDGWGADGLDAWLLSRGYGVLKVNYRGSSGFGRRWSSTVHNEDTNGGFLEDVAAAVRWALHERRVLAGAGPAEEYLQERQPPPVAIMGNYFGGYVALQAMLHHHGSLFACGVAVAPTQALPWWPDSHVPTAQVRTQVEALRGAESWRDGAATAARSDPAATVLAPAAHARELRKLPLLVLEFERDGPDARGELLQSLAPLGSMPSDWPRGLSFVQYAGEGRGGGVIRQNGLDQYRRIDGFLYKHLSPLVPEGNGLQCEPFIDELPFVSAALLPQTSGNLSPHARSIEQGFEDGLRELDPEQAAILPELSAASGRAAGAGFGGGASPRVRAGRRKALVAPTSRLAVREDGIVEVHVALGEEPKGLHVLLSEVWLHIRAQGLGFTVALPRQPLRDEKVGAYRLPGTGSYVFEVAADPNVGAVENYNAWAAAGGRATILSVLGPEEITAAPMVVAAEVLDV